MRGWMKIPKAAEYAGLGTRTLRKLLRQGLRHSRLPSGTVLISIEAVDEFLAGFEVREDKVAQIVDAVVSDLGGVE
ncbi:MAG: helix-turn-helix domain-containing protein [Desulfobacteraceae bacterium]|jgi:hypothetical protein